MIRNSNNTNRRSWGIMLILLLTSPFLAKAQQEVLDGYIREALANNLVLKQKNVSIEWKLD